jgi:hypothetical protein
LLGHAQAVAGNKEFIKLGAFRMQILVNPHKLRGIVNANPLDFGIIYVTMGTFSC